MKNILIFVFIIFLLCGCQNNASVGKTSELESIKNTEDTTAPKVYKDFDRNESANYEALHSDDEEGDGTTVSQDVFRQIARAEGRFITIEDFDIEKDSTKSLPPSVLSDSQFLQLLGDINGHNYTNDWFRLYYLIPYDEWVSFREIKDISKAANSCFYCIMKNQKTKERVYLFFEQMEQTYICLEYLLLDSDGLPEPANNENYFCQTEQPNYWMSVIPKCDL